MIEAATRGKIRFATIVGAFLLVAGFTAAPGAQSRSGRRLASAGGGALDYELQIYLPGVDPLRGEPFRRVAIPASTVSCDQARVAVAAVVTNPTEVRWHDPQDPLKDCVADVGSAISGLPVTDGPYVATLTAISPSGASEPSDPSPIFFRSRTGNR